MKENDDNGLLHQIDPTLPSLLKYLQVENNGQKIAVKNIEKKNGIDILIMTNGFSYFINRDNNWEMLL